MADVEGASVLIVAKARLQLDNCIYKTNIQKKLCLNRTFTTIDYFIYFFPKQISAQAIVMKYFPLLAVTFSYFVLYKASYHVWLERLPFLEVSLKWSFVKLLPQN